MTATRVIVTPDEFPEPPYDEGSPPILYAPHLYGDGWPTQVKETTTYVVNPRLVEAWGRWKRDTKRFERYARAFHGATGFAYRETRDGSYVTFDPVDWRTDVGVLEAAPKVEFGEYGHYLDGDVWDAVSQEKCDHGEWHTVAVVGGLYGEEGDPQLRQYAYEILEGTDDE